jgi:plastocyanin
MRYAIVALVLAASACGGEKGAQPASTPAAAPAAAAPAAPAATGTVHEVRMQLVNKKYMFEPAALTIKAGDTVKWINFSGGPHNVSFKKDKVPAGALAVLNTNMPNRIPGQDATGPFLTDSLGTFQVSFANAPAGTYTYTCQPHEMLGMNGTITVQP